MGDGFPLIDIVLFAMVAAFLFLRLRSVLGRRTGQERQRPNPFVPEQRPDQQPNGRERTDVVRPLPIMRPEPPRPQPDLKASATPLATGLAEIKLADPNFHEDSFLAGARVAFEMIVEAYARGDLAALRPLLADDVYEKFAGAIRSRESAGETLETTLSGIRILDVVEARMEGRVAVVTVKFVSDQINLLRDRAGTVLDGDPAKPVEVVDLWTFSRHTRGRDPNWTLIATRTPN
ncbi:MAG: Tim44 domain-containing protein [Proteobacteria bacterium]|nr:Tim44 domain-containing protein [Pseudomonadota bacterium]